MANEPDNSVEPTFDCPECGVTDYIVLLHYEKSAHKHLQCRNCTQEYFTDIDYGDSKCPRCNTVDPEVDSCDFCYPGRAGDRGE